MRFLMKMIAAALNGMRRAARAMVRKTVEIGGKLVDILVPGSATMEAIEQEDTETAGPDFSYELGIRSAAAVLLEGGVPALELLSELQTDHVEWLAACSDDMLHSIIRATHYEVRDHLRGRKSICGVLCSDLESVQRYLAFELRDGDEPELQDEWVPRAA